LLPITAASGQAKITSGWTEVGSVLLRSDSRFAYQALWDTAVQTALAAAAVTLLSGILATLVLRRLRKPLLAVTQQAQALSERRFITMALPKVPELQPLVLAMNSMVERLKAMLETEAARLERLRQAERTNAVAALERSGKKVIEITLDQVSNFCGNLLQLKSIEGQRYWVCSERAYKAFTPAQRSELENDAKFIHTPLPTIETLGGGSARCMLGEIY
jgi:methyl-accepting chemotaxis protein